jgi:hypothetical protein
LGREKNPKASVKFISLKMSSQNNPSLFRHGSFLLSQDEPYQLAPKGHSALVSLIRSQSTASLQNLLGKDEERVSDWSAFRSLENEDGHIGSEERRMSVVLNGPQMRSMRLIGSSNPRYRWGRYWKTQEQLKTMGKPMLISHQSPLPQANH